MYEYADHRWSIPATIWPGHQSNNYDIELLEITDTGTVPLQLRGVLIKKNADNVLAALKGRKDIETIHFRSSDVSRSSLQYLATLPKLHSLCADSTSLSEQDLGIISGLKNLTSLQIDGSYIDNWNFLGKLNKLQILLINRMRGDATQYFSGLSRLKQLQLKRASNLPATALQRIAQLKSLQAVYLHNIYAAAQDYAQLSQLKQLQLLEVQGNTSGPADAGTHHRLVAINDKVIEALTDVPLHYLYLENCRITDHGAALLAAMPSLRRVKLGHCEYLSNKGMRILYDSDIYQINIDVLVEKNDDGDIWNCFYRDSPLGMNKIDFDMDKLNSYLNKQVTISMREGHHYKGKLAQLNHNSDDTYTLALLPGKSSVGIAIKLKDIASVTPVKKKTAKKKTTKKASKKSVKKKPVKKKSTKKANRKPVKKSHAKKTKRR